MDIIYLNFDYCSAVRCNLKNNYYSFDKCTKLHPITDFLPNEKTSWSWRTKPAEKIMWQDSSKSLVKGAVKYFLICTDSSEVGAGLLSGWSAVCQTYKLPEGSTNSLQLRVWSYQLQMPPVGTTKEDGRVINKMEALNYARITFTLYCWLLRTTEDNVKRLWTGTSKNL